MSNKDTSIAAQHPKPQITARDAELIIENMQDTLYRVDAAGCLTYASPSAEALTGFTLRELMGKPVTDLYMHPEKRAEFVERLAASGGRLNNYEVELRHKTGRGIWVLINVRRFHDVQAGIGGIEGIIRDITSRKLTEQALEYEREKADVTLKAIADGVITTDERGRIDYMNAMATTITGWTHAAARDLDIEAVYRPAPDAGNGEVINPVLECIRTGDSVMVADIRLLTREDGKEFAVRESASPIRSREGQIIGAVLIIHDVTHIRDMSKQLAYQANHDAQTGLLNRRAFEERVRGALNAAHQRGTPHVLCYMDLDQFKIINDTSGHTAGDAMLVQLANTMHSLMREGDTVARLGGDEFGLLVENCPLERGIRIAEEIREAVANFRFVWEDKIFEIGISIGIVALGRTSGDLTDVLSKADTACFAAKDKGRNRVHVYREDDKGLSHQHREMHWAHEIQRAFQEESFCLYTQTIDELKPNESATEHHREILIRIDNGSELIPPMAFIPAAERYNLMPKIDRWVIQTTLEKLEALHRENALQCMFSINLSGASIADVDFSSFLQEALSSYSVPAHHICFEITETAAISNLNNAVKLIRRATERGCRFALDDFGSGLSSFYYLKHLPVHFLKIDGGFVREIHKDRSTLAMVQAINNVGHVMGLKTIAECVETEEILDKVREIGVDFAQGNFVGEPTPWVYRRSHT